MEERIQKILARAGFGSRRACEEFISAGRVSVNGKLAILGEKADPQIDRILFDGQPIKTAEEPLYIAIYKPRGVLSTVTAPDPRPTVRELVDLPGTLFPVGRLDIDSEGLVLLTNDGELANRLTHPRYGHEKEYRVLVASRPDDEQMEAWRHGVVLEDGYRTRPAVVQFEASAGKGAWLRVVLKEGRKRQIRETGSRLGLPVVKIIRVRIGSLLLGALRPRQWRILTPHEVAELRGEALPAEKTKHPIMHKPGGPQQPRKVDAGHQSYQRASKGGSPASKPVVKNPRRPYSSKQAQSIDGKSTQQKPARTYPKPKSTNKSQKKSGSS
jgi:23S rRNA pseudouridine2605 synthase